jgi:hypothetical protein
LDRPVATAVGSGDDHAKVVPAHWTVAGEIDSHIFGLTATTAVQSRYIDTEVIVLNPGHGSMLKYKGFKNRRKPIPIYTERCESLGLVCKPIAVV